MDDHDFIGPDGSVWVKHGDTTAWPADLDAIFVSTAAPSYAPRGSIAEAFPDTARHRHAIKS